ncbi:hypothetical protein [Solimicrobium silvestre]|uniref:YfhG lipoprotein n=1 Tax=Solimicrobium silvestre TaxID=2099400 RepID=A0A2S9GZZ1_9BURK|nr:hypothetical protein [Solimicrobium silvestre]PRC93302.1 hypothetical protein S2091_2040 [Solimicrobium silvestre]
MNTKIMLAVCGLSSVLLLGCKTPPTSEVIVPSVPTSPVIAPVAAPVHTEIDDLLAYYQSNHQMSQTELLKNLVDLNSALKSPHSDLQKAIILGCLRGPVELSRATVLLDGIIKSSDPQAQRLLPLATLLYANYSEWRRLDDALDKQNQQLKEAQRRADQLSQKLEDLKAIEQQLPSRPHASNESRP